MCDSAAVDARLSAMTAPKIETAAASAPLVAPARRLHHPIAVHGEGEGPPPLRQLSRSVVLDCLQFSMTAS